MSKPKILFMDIETSPILGYTWGIWQQDVIQVKDDWQILSIGWKWLGEKTVHVIGQDDLPGYKPGVVDDAKSMRHIHKLLDEADIVIGHNSDQFDIKKMNARMIVHNLPPPSPFRSIDTKKIAKRYGAFTSNRLGSLAKDLDISLKSSPGGFETWLGCMAGDPKAWRRMKKYNKLDIPPLEDLYIKLRPWIDNHPGLNIYSNRPDACPRCGGNKLQARGYRMTKVQKYQRFKCLSCGGWCSGRKGERSEVQYVC